MKIQLSKLYLLSALIAALGSCDAPSGSSDNPDKPNIVLIITDDQGWGDLGYHGNPDIRTPVLDDLARNSIRFNQFYVSTVCAPTRSCLMTVRYSLRTGVYDTYNGGANMATEETTIAEVLRDNGYRTGMFGKWHLGDNYPLRPQEQGFHHSLMHRSGGMAQVGDVTTYFRFDSAYFDPIFLENGKEVQMNGYCSDIFTEEAIKFLEKGTDRPFFVYLSFNAPHTPLQLPGEYEAMYDTVSFDSTRYPRFERPFPEMNESHKEAARKVYGMVTNIDDNIGKLRKALDRLNLTENTIFIFMTDNGPQQVRYVGGMRGRKGSVYEGGVRVPFFMYHPQLANNRDIETPSAHIDIFPTLLDLCGISTGQSNVDGLSLAALIQGDQTPEPFQERPLFFHWQRGFPEPYRNVAVRQANYKLVGMQAGEHVSATELELYDLAKDPSELRNIAHEKPEVAESLKKIFDDWYKDVMSSEHLNNVRIVLGSDEENPSILNRNDAKASFGIWAEDEVYGYWDVNVARAAEYDVTCHFRDTVTGPGNLLVRIGKVQRTIDNDSNTKSLTIRKMRLPEGDCRVESRYRQGGTDIFPFYIEVERL